MFNKNKFYAVSMKSHPNIFICYCTSKAEAREYVYSFIKAKHQTHFSEWCRYKELNENNWEIFYQYFNTVIDDEEKKNYVIHSLKYNKKDLAAILRMFGSCIPLNCSFEKEIEHKYFNEKEKAREKVSNIIDKFKDDLSIDEKDQESERLIN